MNDEPRSSSLRGTPVLVLILAALTAACWIGAYALLVHRS